MATVEDRRLAENRPVYYSGISDCAVEWNALSEGDSWESCPDKSIIVLDECQRLFPVRKQGSPVPPAVSAMETHRHRGIDIYLVAQNPLQVDSAVRHLVGEYRFLDRPHGHAYAVVWRFGHVCDWRSTLERQTAEKSRWRFPKASFGWYKSAESHTHKRSWPKALLVLPLLLVVVLVAGYYGFKAVTRRGVEASKESSAAVGTKVNLAVPSSGYLSPAAWQTERAHYLQDRTPRIREAPESAPIYDSLATVVAFPRVAACVLSEKKGCKCMTQQGTPLVVADEFCFAFVEHGAFDPYAVAAAVATGDGQATGVRSGGGKVAAKAQGPQPATKAPEPQPPPTKPGVSVAPNRQSS